MLILSCLQFTRCERVIVSVVNKLDKLRNHFANLFNDLSQASEEELLVCLFCLQNVIQSTAVNDKGNLPDWQNKKWRNMKNNRGKQLLHICGVDLAGNWD